MSPEELSALQLEERRSIAAMGAISTWNNRQVTSCFMVIFLVLKYFIHNSNFKGKDPGWLKLIFTNAYEYNLMILYCLSFQLTTLFTRVLNSTKRTPSQLDSSMLVALGHIVCGAKTTEIKTFNNVELRWAQFPLWMTCLSLSSACHFYLLSCVLSPPAGCSKAVLWLGQLRLSCSEDQMLALVELLTNNLAFGPMDSWGTDVFIEIGVLAGNASGFGSAILMHLIFQ